MTMFVAYVLSILFVEGGRQQALAFPLLANSNRLIKNVCCPDHPFLLPFRPSRSFVTLSSSASDEDSSISEAEQLAKKADQLRAEIAAFEEGKKKLEMAEREKEEEVQREKQEKRNRYSAEVPILKGDGSTVVERVDFPPRMPLDKSYILVCETSLPLGIVLGEHEEIPGAIEVDEVLVDGNAGAAGVKEGDLLRACTACRASMKTPTWQLLAGGIGQPQTQRMMFATDGNPFEEVMEAVGSNRMDPEGRPVVLVLERKEQ